MKGKFIAFEGIDGCGKSTQTRKLVEYIHQKDKYNHVVMTRNPYKDVKIRQVILEDNNPSSQAQKLADMFIQDRRNHVEEIIKPNVDKGLFVITDRYKFSTICYQSAQGLLMEELIKRQDDLPKPDVTFIVDVPVEVVKERMQKEDVKIRGKEHKFEADLEFTKKLRENYIKAAELMKSNGEKVFVINGNRTPEEIFEEIKNIFDREVFEKNGSE